MVIHTFCLISLSGSSWGIKNWILGSEMGSMALRSRTKYERQYRLPFPPKDSYDAGCADAESAQNTYMARYQGLYIAIGPPIFNNYSTDARWI